MQKRKQIMPYGVIFTMLFALCWLFPYSGDDWAWGSTVGIDRLKIWFDNYNGRYVGNLIVLALTRSNFLKAITMAACLTGIMYFMCRIIPASCALPIACFLMTALPRSVFSQAIVWTSGFSNYAMSIFFVMIFIADFYPILDGSGIEENGRQEIAKSILFGILGVVSTLVMENMTIYCVVVSLAAIAFVGIKYRKVAIRYLLFSIGSIFGAAYMFSNSVYHSIAVGTDGYRTMPSGISALAHQVWYNYSEEIGSQWIMGSSILNIFVLAACAYGFRKNRAKMNKICTVAVEVCLIVMAGLLSAFALALPSLPAVKGASIWGFRAVVLSTALYVMAVIAASTIIAFHTGAFYKIAFLNCSVICMAAPLLVVTPVGSRNYFPIYVIMIMLILELINCSCDKEVDYPAIKKCLYTACIAGFAFYLFIFMMNHMSDRARLEHIRTELAKGETKITVLKYPFEEFIWNPNPTEGSLEYRYKLFYGIPDDVDLVP